MVLADMLVEENIGSSFSRKGRQGDSIGSSDLRILLRDLWMQAIHTEKGTIGYTKRSISTVRSFDSISPCKRVPGGKESLTLRIVEEIAKGSHLRRAPKL